MIVTFALFLIAHGLIHIAIYAMPVSTDPTKPAPFDPSHSWALAARHAEPSAMRSASIALALAVGAAYSASGWMLLLDAGWTASAAVGAGVGLTLKALWFHPWLSVGVALDLAVLGAVLVGWPA